MFNEISLLFIEDMHVFKSNFIAIDTIKPLLELFDCVWSIVTSLISKIFDYDFLIEFLWGVSELCGWESVMMNFTVDLFVLGKVERVDFWEMVT